MFEVYEKTNNRLKINGIKKKGFSLIVLVITVIILLIIASATILILNRNNLVSSAKESVFESDIDSFRDELTAYHSSERLKNEEYNPKSLNANTNGITKNTGETNGNIENVIPDIRKL